MTAGTSTHSLFDPQEVERALELFLSPGQVTEIRALDATVNGDRFPTTYTGYFDKSRDVLAALDTIHSAKGLYFVPNPVNEALIARANNRIRGASKGESTSDRDIVRRRYLLIDCDVIRPEGISATDDEHAAAIKRAKAIATELHYNYGWPDPIIGDSGNGGHLEYRIDEPVDDGGLVQRCLLALAAKFDDDRVKVDTGVFNPARIWKLPGTRACKGDSIEARPHRMSRILVAPSQLGIVSHKHLLELAAEAPAEEKRRESSTKPTDSPFDIDAFIARHGLELSGPDAYQGGRRWTFTRSPMCDHHDDGPYLVQFASGALAAGCHHDSCSWGWHDLRANFAPKQEWQQKSDSYSERFRDEPPRREVVYRKITSAELMGGDYKIDYLIEGAMVQGQPLTIGGPMKVLKTSILIDAAISLANGGYFLGRFKVNGPRRVLVMSGESGLATLQETALRIAATAGIGLAGLTNLIWSPDIPKFSSIDHLDALEKFLGDNGIEVLFVDPAYLCMPSADAANLMAQGELLRNIGELCQRLKVTLIICHHTKRNTGQDPFEPLELQHLAWAGHAEFARQWILINRREKYQPGTGDHRLWLSLGGSAGHSSLWAADIHEGLITDPGGRRWEVQLSDAAGARDAAAERKKEVKLKIFADQLEADRKTICEALAALPNQTGTKTDIKDATHLNESRFKPAFASLITDKMLVRTTIIKGNNQSYDAYTFNKD